MITPWGQSQQRQQLEPGCWWVSTAGHGGILVGTRYAEEYLTPEARKLGEPFGSWLAYEEDCAWAVVIWELPRLSEAFSPQTRAEDLRSEAFHSLSCWNADYLLATGVEPELEGYTRYLAMKEDDRMRREKHPDLIVCASGSWHTGIPGVTEVITADGVKHLVDAASYLTSNHRLSACVLYHKEDS